MKKRRFTEKKSISSMFSLFLAFALMVTSVLGSSLGTLEVQAAEGTLSGSGTYNDPYIIEDAADLKAFAALMFQTKRGSLCRQMSKMPDIPVYSMEMVQRSS